jgi:hypothetical protein
MELGVRTVSLSKVWNEWKRISRIVGDVVGRVVLTAFYFTILVPFGLAVRLLGDPLGTGAAARDHWHQRAHASPALDDARKLS